MSTLSAFLTAARAQLLTATGAVTSEETIYTIRGDGRSPRHLEVAVGAPRTAPLPGPQKVSVGLPARHEVVVLAAFQLKPKDRATSGDTAHAFADSLRAAMLSTSWLSGATVAAIVTYTGTICEPGPDGWLWFTLTFNVLQTVAIS